MKLWQSPLFACGSLSLATASLVILVQLAGLLDGLECQFFDAVLIHRPYRPVDPRIVILAETEADLHRFGYPLADRVFAQALQKLEEAGARVIGVDKYRDMPVAPGTDELTQVLQRYSNIIWIFFVGRIPDEQVTPPAVLKNSQRIGFNNVTEDADGITRRGLLFMDQGNSTHYAFPLVIALNYLEREQIQASADSDGYLQLGGISLRPIDRQFGAYTRADSRGYQIMLDYPGLSATEAFTAYSLSQLLDNQVPAAALRDKIVLLGSKAHSLLDYRFFPGQLRYFGVEQHGYFISQLLTTAQTGKPPLQSISDHWERSGIWLCCLLGIITGWRYRSLWSLLGLMLLEAAAILATGTLLLIQGWWLPTVAFAGGWFSGLVLSVAFFSIQEHAMRQQLMRLFESHVSPQVAAALWQTREQFFSEGRVRPDNLTATVLFTDLSGFTSIAENMEPMALMQWLNQYMEAMTQIIIDHGGMINKYIGDAIMAVFGAPVKRDSEAAIADDAQRAIACALAFNQRLRELNQLWQQQGLPTLTMRTGIYTGSLVAGSLGGSSRTEYTVIGNTVNTASRLESFDKDINTPDAENPCRILIGESTYAYIAERYPVELVAECQLKGQQHALKIYRVLTGGISL